MPGDRGHCRRLSGRDMQERTARGSFRPRMQKEEAHGDGQRVASIPGTIQEAGGSFSRRHEASWPVGRR